MGPNNPFLFKRAMSYVYTTSLKFILESLFIKPRNHQLLGKFGHGFFPKQHGPPYAISFLFSHQKEQSTVKKSSTGQFSRTVGKIVYTVYTPSILTIPVGSIHEFSSSGFTKRKTSERNSMKFDLQDLRQFSKGGNL